MVFSNLKMPYFQFCVESHYDLKQVIFFFVNWSSSSKRIFNIFTSKSDKQFSLRITVTNFDFTSINNCVLSKIVVMPYFIRKTIDIPKVRIHIFIKFLEYLCIQSSRVCKKKRP